MNCFAKSGCSQTAPVLHFVAIPLFSKRRVNFGKYNCMCGIIFIDDSWILLTSSQSLFVRQVMINNPGAFPHSLDFFLPFQLMQGLIDHRLDNFTKEFSNFFDSYRIEQVKACGFSPMVIGCMSYSSILSRMI